MMETTVHDGTKKSGTLQYSKLVGKYVCYGNDRGGFCWGRIKVVVETNTQDGYKPSFILTDRKTCLGPNSPIRDHPGETLLRVEAVNLEKDIVDKEEFWEGITDDELFILVMGGEVGLAEVKNLGFVNMLKHARGDLEEWAKGELRGRMNMEDE